MSIISVLNLLIIVI